MDGRDRTARGSCLWLGCCGSPGAAIGGSWGNSPPQCDLSPCHQVIVPFWKCRRWKACQEELILSRKSSISPPGEAGKPAEKRKESAYTYWSTA